MVAKTAQTGNDAEANSWTDYDAASAELERLASLNPNMLFILVELTGMARSEMATKVNVQMI